MSKHENFIMEIPGDMFDKTQTEEDRVNWILLNTFFNGSAHDSVRLTDHPEWEPYNWMEEAMSFAREKDYFPDMTDEDRLAILRKYDGWVKFEKAYGNT